MALFGYVTECWSEGWYRVQNVYLSHLPLLVAANSHEDAVAEYKRILDLT